jgi:hypothetical protein
LIYFDGQWPEIAKQADAVVLVLGDHS